MVEYLLKINFFKLHDLGAVALALVLGAAIFYLVMRTGAYRLRIPYWLGADFIGSLAGSIAVALWYLLTLPFIACAELQQRAITEDV
jgi:hypothetical protein